MVISFRFQLAIQDDNYIADITPMDEYLRARQEGVILWQPSLMDSWILLEANGKELLDQWWNLGDLELIVLQCEEAHRRLVVGQEAIIRSGVLDQSVVPYLLMTPTSTDEVDLSLFVIPDLEAGFAFPIDHVSGNSKELWAYLYENREQLLHPVEPPVNGLFSDVPCSKAQLIAALEREAALGRQLFATVGHDMHWETGDLLTPISEYLLLRDKGTVTWQPDIEQCSVFLAVDGKELVASDWSLGNLMLIVLQCEEVYRRLKEGQEAIIHSGVLESSVPYLLFEPQDNHETLLSLFLISDSKAGFAFPIDHITGDSQDLWSYVREHREQLLSPPTAAPDYFTRVPCPSDELVAALERETALGRQLLELFGFTALPARPARPAPNLRPQLVVVPRIRRQRGSASLRPPIAPVSVHDLLTGQIVVTNLPQATRLLGKQVVQRLLRKLKPDEVVQLVNEIGPKNSQRLLPDFLSKLGVTKVEQIFQAYGGDAMRHYGTMQHYGADFFRDYKGVTRDTINHLLQPGQIRHGEIVGCHDDALFLQTLRNNGQILRTEVDPKNADFIRYEYKLYLRDSAGNVVQPPQLSTSIHTPEKTVIRGLTSNPARWEVAGNEAADAAIRTKNLVIGKAFPGVAKDGTALEMIYRPDHIQTFYPDW